jgi:hypothetical protein
MAAIQPVNSYQENEPLHWTETLQSAPPWLGSMVVHMMVLIFLGLIVVTAKKASEEPPIQAVYGEGDKLGQQLIEDNSLGPTTDKPDPTITETQFSPTNLPPVADPLALPPMATSFSQHGQFAGSNTPTGNAPIGIAFKGRERGSKKGLVARYGGNATTESAVHEALEWLKRNQRANGSWALNGPYSEGGESENHVAATAMALLAFQGAGNTHLFNADSKYDYKSIVRKGWDALLKTQSSDGEFTESGLPEYHVLYSHAQATIALCELYGMTHDSSYRGPAEKAIQFCIQSQDLSAGGWRYTPRSDSDTSVTGWFVMALQSAMMAELTVPPATFQNVSRYLDSAQGDGGSRYYYQPGRNLNNAMTAEGLLCRQYLGWAHDDPRLIAGVEYIAKHPVSGDADVYYWYYATQVMHHMGGDYWKHWNEVMRQLIPETQTKRGPEEGSWDPSGDNYAQRAGRLYATCLRTYMLEVYYRHLPLYTNVYDQKAESGSMLMAEPANSSKSETTEPPKADSGDSTKPDPTDASKSDSSNVEKPKPDAAPNH